MIEYKFLLNIYVHFHLGTCLGVEWLGQWVHVCSFSDIAGFLMIHLFSFIKSLIR